MPDEQDESISEVRDVVFIFQFSNDAEDDTINMILNDNGIDRRGFVEQIICPTHDQIGQDTIWKEFVQKTGISRDPIVLSLLHRSPGSSTKFRADASRADGQEVQPGLADEHEDTETIPETGSYPWAARANLKAIIKGERALSVEKVECSEDGDFVIVSIGKVLKPGKLPEDGTEPAPATVTREELVAANIYRDAAGVPGDREAIEASIDPEYYWCVPKKELCYQPVEFGTFGLSLRKGRSGDIPFDAVYNLRLGIVTALQRVVMDHCPQ